MKKESKELLAVAEKWLEEIKDITVEYERASRSLEDARKDYQLWKSIFNWFFPLLSVVIVLFLLGSILKNTCPNPLDIKFQGLEITQHCSIKK